MEGSLSLFETIRTKYYYGKTVGIYLRKQPYHAKRKLKLFRLAFVRNWKILKRHPLLTVGMLYMKCCEFLGEGLGFINSKFKEINHGKVLGR